MTSQVFDTIHTFSDIAMFHSSLHTHAYVLYPLIISQSNKKVSSKEAIMVVIKATKCKPNMAMVSMAIASKCTMASKGIMANSINNMAIMSNNKATMFNNRATRSNNKATVANNKAIMLSNNKAFVASNKANIEATVSETDHKSVSSTLY